MQNLRQCSQDLLRNWQNKIFSVHKDIMLGCQPESTDLTAHCYSTCVCKVLITMGTVLQSPLCNEFPPAFFGCFSMSKNQQPAG